MQSCGLLLVLAGVERLSSLLKRCGSVPLGPLRCVFLCASIISGLVLSGATASRCRIRGSAPSPINGVLAPAHPLSFTCRGMTSGNVKTQNGKSSKESRTFGQRTSVSPHGLKREQPLGFFPGMPARNTMPLGWLIRDRIRTPLRGYESGALGVRYTSMRAIGSLHSNNADDDILGTSSSEISSDEMQANGRKSGDLKYRRRLRRKLSKLEREVKAIADEIAAADTSDENEDLSTSASSSDVSDLETYSLSDSDLEDDQPEESGLEWPWDDETATSGIRNYQSGVPVDKGLLEVHTQLIKEIMGIERGIIRTDLIDEATMKELNMQSRGIDDCTDVLSFPYSDSERVQETFPMLKSIVSDASLTNGDTPLGYVFLCPGHIQKQLDADRATLEKGLEQGEALSQQDSSSLNQMISESMSLQTRLAYLQIHSFLHLLHYDHESPEQAAEMEKKEVEIAKAFQARFRDARPSPFGHRVIGIGTDVCHIPRIRHTLEKKETGLIDRVFGPREKYNYYRLKKIFNERAEKKRLSWIDYASAYVAKRFATKEAVAKALGVGLRHVTPTGIKLRDIEVMSLRSGQPVVLLRGEGQKLGANLGIGEIFVTQTDEAHYALAFATACAPTSDVIPLSPMPGVA